MSRLLRKLALCSKTDTVSSHRGSEAECAVCQDQAVKPCTVPCGNQHVFCQACLQGLVSHNRYTSHFPCPLCRMRVRIPLGGVGAFRQGRGVRQRILARLPAIRPRCRSPADSLSSGWLDDAISPTIFEGADFAFSSGSEDNDSLSSLGVPSEEAQSLNVDSWLNSIDPEQVFYLEEIHRHRAQSDGSQPAVLDQAARRSSSSSGSGGESAEAAGDERGTEQEEDSPFGAGGPEDWLRAERDEMVAYTLPDELAFGEDLDMTVVLQMIADMENKHLRHARHADCMEEEGEEEEERAEQRQAEKTPTSACHDSPKATNTTSDETHPPDSSQEEGASGDQDWKLRAIAGTAIPRPKVSLARDLSEEERSFRAQEDEEPSVDFQLPLPQQVSADSCGLEEEAVEELRCLDVLLNNAVTDPESPEIDPEGAHTITDQNVSLESPRPHPDCRTERSAFHPQEVVSGVEAETGSLSAEDQDYHPPQTRPELSERRRPRRSSCNLPEFPSSPSTTEDRPHSSRETGSLGDPAEDLSAEGWRQRELLRLQAAAAKLRKGPADDDPCPDTETVIISEGPNEWVRRIRSLQHRRRVPTTKRGVSRSHSQGSKAECGERGGEKEADREEGGKQLSERKGIQRVAVPVPEKDLKSSAPCQGTSHVRNITIINL